MSGVEAKCGSMCVLFSSMEVTIRSTKNNLMQLPLGQCFSNCETEIKLVGYNLHQKGEDEEKV